MVPVLGCRALLIGDRAGKLVRCTSFRELMTSGPVDDGTYLGVCNLCPRRRVSAVDLVAEVGCCGLNATVGSSLVSRRSTKNAVLICHILVLAVSTIESRDVHTL